MPNAQCNANTEQERGQDEQQQPLLLFQAREDKRMQVVKERRPSTTMEKQSGWNKVEEKDKVIIRLGGNHALVERVLKREEEKRVEWFVVETIWGGGDLCANCS